MDSFGVVVFGRDGRVALRKPTNGFGGYVWTHATGQPDRGDTPAKTAMREAREELGYKVRILEPLGVFNSTPTYKNFYFLAFALEGPFKTDWETEAVRWFTVDEARKSLTLSAKVYGNKEGSRRDIRVFEAALKAMKGYQGQKLGQIPAEPFMASAPVFHGGSNPGGIYTGADGKLRYIKFSKTDPQQIALENFTNHLYNDLKVPALQTYVVLGVNPATGKREFGLGSDFLGVKQFPARPSKDLVRQYVDGVVVDMFTSNWDAGPHNLAVTEDGTVLRMDQGGALLFRAQGEQKSPRHLMPPSETVTFFQDFSLPNFILIPAGYRRYADIADVANKKIDAIVALRKKYGGWAGYVQERGEFIAPAYAKRVVKLLEDRTGWFDQNRP